MTAFDKFCEDMSRNNQQLWINVLMNGTTCIADFTYGCSISTFRQQARKAGFSTKMIGDDVIMIYRKNL